MACSSSLPMRRCHLYEAREGVRRAGSRLQVVESNALSLDAEPPLAREIDESADHDKLWRAMLSLFRLREAREGDRGVGGIRCHRFWLAEDVFPRLRWGRRHGGGVLARRLRSFSWTKDTTSPASLSFFFRYEILKETFV